VATETIKIARMQQRRGLKQDLPKPLRPGEIGFATDSRQIYIGADTSDPAADTYNKTAVFETTQNAQSTTLSLSAVQMIKFTVPNKFYNRNEVFNGAVSSDSWLPTSFSDSTNTSPIFRSGDTTYTNIFTGAAFRPADITVTLNGSTLTPANTATIASSEDYFFTAGTANTSVHTLTFRSQPSASEIGITYYGNAAVIQSFYGNVTGKVGVTGVNSFYADAGILSASYRHIANTNILVAPDTGVGFIGLEFKHIQVATDVKQPPAPGSANNLGKLLANRTSDAEANLTLTANATSITVAGVSSNSYDLAGNIDHILIETGNTNQWLDSKVMLVTEYDGANSTVVASLPANASSITKLVTRTEDASPAIRVYCDPTEVEIGDAVYIIDSANVANADTYVANVLVVNTADGFIEIDNSTEQVLANIGFTAGTEPVLITYKSGVPSTVVVTSILHGLTNGNEVSFSSSIIDGGSAIPVTYTGNANTFVVTTPGNITSNVASLTFTPVVSNATVTATPVFAATLSAANSLDDVVAAVNSTNQWVKLYRVPNTVNQVYVTHSDAAISSLADDTFSFRIHNDANLTLTTLGLTSGEYNRQNSTVKGKLEKWLYDVLTDSNVNLFTDVLITEEFYNSPGNFNSFDLTLNSTLGEITFDSRSEVRDFTGVLNNLYFDSVNPDIKGLMNIKTNIEFLTKEALESGAATTDYTSTESITITSGISSVSELSANVDGTFDTFFVEYSMKDNYAPTSNVYKRIGTLKYTGDSTAGETLITDVFSDIRANVTGNVVFTATISGSDLTIVANNSLSPSMPVTMNYIVRRWS
jgi:hypothetical protein